MLIMNVKEQENQTFYVFKDLRKLLIQILDLAFNDSIITEKR